MPGIPPGFGPFDPILNQAAREYLRTRGPQDGFRALEKGAEELGKAIAKNPKAVQAIEKTVESGLQRLGTQQATRYAVGQAIRALAVDVGEAIMAAVPVVALVAAAIIAAYLIFKAYEWLNEKANEIQRANSERWKNLQSFVDRKAAEASFGHDLQQLSRPGRLG
jgi:hypothetical protein